MVFLKDGASELSEVVTKLMFKILEEEKTPEQWKVARILPLLKKGDKEKTENYRPISNLCSMTKVYEKLLLHRFQKIQEKEMVDFTGNCQHGFKRNFSTETACLEIQTKLSKACDSGGFAALVSLNLTSFMLLTEIFLENIYKSWGYQFNLSILWMTG